MSDNGSVDEHQELDLSSVRVISYEYCTIALEYLQLIVALHTV